jgi:hypothetical protein
MEFEDIVAYLLSIYELIVGGNNDRHHNKSQIL